MFLKRLKELNIESKFFVSSSATSFEEIGHRVHRGTCKVLDRFNIDYSKKRACHLEKTDYEKYDYFLVMDDMNLRDAKFILGGDSDKKVYKLLDFTDCPRDVADPWWTGDFEATFNDITRGIDGFLKYLGEV